jgi:hypothetical protein
MKEQEDFGPDVAEPRGEGEDYPDRAAVAVILDVTRRGRPGRRIRVAFGSLRLCSKVTYDQPTARLCKENHTKRRQRSAQQQRVQVYAHPPTQLTCSGRNTLWSSSSTRPVNFV